MIWVFQEMASKNQTIYFPMMKKMNEVLAPTVDKNRSNP
jgi:hypothetical protein